MLAPQKKISIIVPVRNGEAFLTECLTSLVEQTRPADELLIVDNASSDRTKNIILAFAQQYKNITYLFADRRGRGQARNAGLRQAQGDIIAMTDADCVVPKDWLERLVEPIENNRETVTMGFEADGIDNYWSRLRQASDYKFFQSQVKNGYINFLDTKNFAMRADILKTMSFNSTLPACEDLDLFLRLKQKKIAIRFLPDLRVKHRHVSSFRKLWATQFTYGRYSENIYRHYRADKSLSAYQPIDDHPDYSPARKFLSLLIWSVDEILHHPQEAPYNLTADWAWKIGIIYSQIRKQPFITRESSDSDY